MRTSIYIDGFNLYYRVKGTDYKWLDLMALCQNLLDRQHAIDTINYYTTKVEGRKKDPRKPERQGIYWRALQKYIPQLRIKLGLFQQRKVMMPRADNEEKFVYVIRTEEKGTDVNLAVNLLNDMWLDKYDCAVIISNDSDLAEAMCLVRKHSEKILILIPPFPPQKNGQYQEN
ncbi:MAG: NYN domain-containing protein [Candidatus Zeuxoniibacter abyssi]|nr:MAG: NYN domain-containing protein [Candidatus Persebacteraceae bacterium AB1(2)]